MRTLLLLLLLPYGSVAQEFRPILLNKARWYVDLSSPLPHTTLGIRIDTIGLSGSDSLLFNYKTFNNSDLEVVESPFMDSWIGPYTLVQPNRHVFFNGQHDSLFIPRFFPVSDEWKLYVYPNGNYIGFSDASSSEQSIIGVEDTVLTLVLKVFDSEGEEIDAPGINGKKIVIGKGNGLIRFFDVRVFPQQVLDITLSPTYNGTHWIKYTNYSSGDMLTTSSVVTYNGPPDYYSTSKKLLLVTSSTVDSRVFSTEVVQSHRYLNLNTLQWVTDSTTSNATLTLPIFPDSALYTHYSSMPYEAMPLDSANPTEWTVNNQLYFEPDSSLKCAPFGYYVNPQWVDFTPWHLEDSVWRKLYSISDGVFCNGVWYPGLSQTWREGCYSNEYGDSHTTSSSSYWQTSGVTCGSVVVGIEQPDPYSETFGGLKIYPNPANEYLRFQTPEPVSNNVRIIAMDMYGHTVLDIEAETLNFDLNVSEWPNGLYVLQLVQGDVSSSLRVVVQH